MAKKHWDELKEKYNWTEEIFPIAVWNQTLFLGCIEPPSNKIQIPGFDVRLVLVNYSSLENRWHFIQKFLKPLPLISKEFLKKKHRIPITN